MTQKWTHLLQMPLPPQHSVLDIAWFKVIWSKCSNFEWRGPLPCPRPGNRGRGRGEVFQTLQWFSGKGRAFSNRGQKGTFPDYNNHPGMKRGQSPVVPFKMGGEGDGNFNGFVLSTRNTADQENWMQGLFGWNECRRLKCSMLEHWCYRGNLDIRHSELYCL